MVDEAIDESLAEIKADLADRRLIAKEQQDAHVAANLRNTHLQERIATLEAWVDDLQSGMWINCVYCGHRYGPQESTPVSMADVLKEHIRQCPQHPLSKTLTALRNLVEILPDMKPMLPAHWEAKKLLSNL